MADVCWNFLLTGTLQNSPERADYRAKLLDTHFATKNKDAFVKEAEALKSLGRLVARIHFGRGDGAEIKKLSREIA